jgi:integrase
MGHVQDRWYRNSVEPGTGRVVREKTSLFGSGMRYKVRYQDLDGRERSRSFPDKSKRLADDFLLKVESQKRDGSYVDPNAGRTSFRTQAESWLKGQSSDRATRRALESRLTSQIYPHFAALRVDAIKTTHVRDWLGHLDEAKFSQNYRTVLFNLLTSVLDSAVEDRLITVNPCKAKSIKRPTAPRSNIVVWSPERLFAVMAGIEDRFRILVTVGAGCGLRQGELLGLSPDDVDVSTETLHVRRQLRIADRQLVFSLPKGGKARRVPLPASVASMVAAHGNLHPPAAVTLDWTEPGGEPTKVRLLATGESGRLYSGDLFNKTVWRNAFVKQGLTQRRRADGMHALRHFYASALLSQGVSIKELAEYLGHTDPGFTLRTYTHLVPTSFDRARAAIDGLLAGPVTADGLHAA